MDLANHKNIPALMAAAGALACFLACGGRGSEEPNTGGPASPHIRQFSAHPAVIKRGEAAHLHAEFVPGRALITPDVGPVQSGVHVLVSPQATTTYVLRLRTPIAGEEQVRSVTIRVE